MHALYVSLGLLLSAYVVQALMAGTVYGKSGLWGRMYRRDQSPFAYWSAVAAYSVLALALTFAF